MHGKWLVASPWQWLNAGTEAYGNLFSQCGCCVELMNWDSLIAKWSGMLTDTLILAHCQLWLQYAYQQLNKLIKICQLRRRVSDQFTEWGNTSASLTVLHSRSSKSYLLAIAVLFSDETVFVSLSSSTEHYTKEEYQQGRSEIFLCRHCRKDLLIDLSELSFRFLSRPVPSILHSKQDMRKNCDKGRIHISAQVMQLARASIWE